MDELKECFTMAELERDGVCVCVCVCVCAWVVGCGWVGGWLGGWVGEWMNVQVESNPRGCTQVR